MRRYLLILVILAFMGSTTYAQYANQWKTVESFEKQSLPKSALEVVDEIYQDAMKNNNSAEVIKAIIYQIKYKTVIDNDKYSDIIKEVEAFTEKVEDKTEQAVLYSMLANLYAKYYSVSRNNSTAISGYVPEDIREWPANVFIQKISDLVDLSLVNAKELQETPTLEYAAILEEGKSSRNLRPTLYDFLVNEGINILEQLNGSYKVKANFPQSDFIEQQFFAPVEEFIKIENIQKEKYDFPYKILSLYQQLLAFRYKENDDLALLIPNLERLDFVKNNYRGESGDENYTNALEHLKNKYSKQDFVVEVLDKEAYFYIMKVFSAQEGLNESSKRAYEICNEGIKAYPKYERIGLLKNQLSNLTESYANIESDNAVYPGEGLDLRIRYQNCSSIKVEIYKINAPVTVYANSWNRKGQYSKKGTLVKKETVKLPALPPYVSNDTIINIPIDELGLYEYVIKTDKYSNEPANQQFSVSRLASISRTVDDKREYIVVDRVSGKPIGNAAVKLYARNNKQTQLKLIKTYTTDVLGLAQDNGEEGIASYSIVKDNDNALVASFAPWVSTRREVKAKNTRLDIFTDRSIYRPGQVVYFKGIAYDLDKQTVLSNKTYSITFRDANNNEITKQDFKTNEFGSFAGEFVIPQSLLTGHFSIRADKDNGYVNFRVEEYKRPTFDIEFDKNEKAYTFGDEISITGNVKSYSGVNLQNSEVKYRVVRRNHWLFRFLGYREVQVAKGSVFTDENGKFGINFVADKAFEDKNKEDVYYRYTIEVEVTNTNGETQSSIKLFSIGDKSMYLSFANNYETIDKDNPKNITVTALNLSDNKIDTDISYELYSFKAKDINKLDDNDNWEQDKLILTITSKSGEAISIPNVSSLLSGRYKIVAKAKDQLGREVETEGFFDLMSKNDKTPHIPTYLWFLGENTECAVGEKAEIIIGSSTEAYVLYEIFKEGKKLAVERFTLNSENKKIEIPFLETYGDGVTANFCFIKDKQLFSRSIDIKKKQPNKSLDIKMEVFRDYLLPGQTEEWKISIKDGNKSPVLSEVLAAMYDSSLDKINNHSWSFYPVKTISLWGVNNRAANEFGTSGYYLRYDYVFKEVPDFNYDSFNWFGFNLRYSSLLKEVYFNSSNLRKGGDGKLTTQDLEGMEIVSVEDALDGNIAGLDTGASNKVRIGSSPKVMEDHKVLVEESVVQEVVMVDLKREEETVQIRKNFNETAFFYPQLKTNEAGETIISFTVPESNTTWKFMTLAHTKDLKYGQLIKEAVSQKKLMVSPNVPRFIREGDKVTITSNISNLSEQVVSGNAYVEFFDPANNKTNIRVNNSSQSFSLESGKTTALTWSFTVPSGIELTTFKIVAKSENFSDGEQHIIPVLPNRILVTESMPLNVYGKEKKEYTLDKLANPSSTSDNYRLTLEFSSNPVWYAVQALPSISTPQNDNVLDWFAGYYSNTVATHIANNTPNIKQIIDTWKAQSANKETLLSNLEKNQELKNILLEETPWVMEAENETDQKQRLATLFDVNRATNFNKQAIDKLSSLQVGDGGFTWFKGMNSSVSITQWILYGLGELSQLKDYDASAATNISDNAIAFIDYKFVERYENLKKTKNWRDSKSISTTNLEYLFVRSYYSNDISSETQEAIDFYINIIKKYWTSSGNLYNRAISAIVMNRYNNKDIANNIVKSLREHSTTDKELGMYWANNNTYAFMSQNATTVHSFVMQAFKEVGYTTEEIDGMKLWLLKQKQTQLWEDVPATVNAINILLNSGTDWLSNQENVKIKLGKQTIDTKGAEAGTGYIKKIYNEESIKKNMSKITLEKTSDGAAWGALYYQYYEDLDKLTKATTELNVEKALYVNQTGETGKTLIPVSEDNPLKVGDKITVRLTIRTDRDMEFVHLKDMRASCFEPTTQLSGCEWKQGLIYYKAPKDASMNFYFNVMPKGTYVLEYDLYVTSSGDYSNGMATIQCMYAPEYVSHTAGSRVVVK
ncbi:uncharacterized protein YfaS (alpha-2-macroglobulin family) [Dysgonomonadaceae bacterium PH5-43]|nr:uncharacterized protein YfaS (alpha-2-macroglobulin family) [Dysgonomonadaceae bacterium PH5-43]